MTKNGYYFVTPEQTSLGAEAHKEWAGGTSVVIYVASYTRLYNQYVL